MPRPTALALSAALALAGVTATACGQDDPAEGVRKTMHRLLVAIADGDGKRACALVSDRAQRAFEEGLFGNCVATLTWASSSLPDPEKRMLRKAKVGAVNVEGDRATVRDQDIHVPPGYEGVFDSDPAVLRRTASGEWQIEDMG